PKARRVTLVVGVQVDCKGRVGKTVERPVDGRGPIRDSHIGNDREDLGVVGRPHHVAARGERRGRVVSQMDAEGPVAVNRVSTNSVAGAGGSADPDAAGAANGSTDQNAEAKVVRDYVPRARCSSPDGVVLPSD